MDILEGKPARILKYVCVFEESKEICEMCPKFERGHAPPA
jgi:hypothetical protein